MKRKITLPIFIIAVCLLLMEFSPLTNVHAIIQLTFGYNAIGATMQPQGATGQHFMCGLVASPQYNGTMLDMKVYIHGQSGWGGDIEAAIYNYANGKPTTLLGHSNVISSIGISPQWVWIPFPSVSVVANTKYWLVWWQDAPTDYWCTYGQPNGTCFYIVDRVGWSTFPSTLVGASNIVNSTFEPSIYADYAYISSGITYNNINYYSRLAGSVCNFTIDVYDAIPLSKYIFSFDNGVGILTNDSAVSFGYSGQSQLIYKTKTLTSTINATVRFRWFFNDTVGNWNSTAIQYLTTGTITVVIVPTSAYLTVGQNQTFTANIYGGKSGSLIYQWFLNSAPISGETSYTYIFNPTVAGSYSITVSVTDSSGNIYHSNIVSASVTNGVVTGGPYALTLAYTLLGLVLSLALGALGFGLGGGQSTVSGMFFFLVGFMVSYLLGWFPIWMFVLSIMGLAILLANQLRSVARG